MASRGDVGGRGGDGRGDMAVEIDADDARVRAEWDEVRRQRKELERKAGARREDDEDDDDEQRWLVVVQAQPTTDPFACFCRCGFKKIGQSYILQDKRIMRGSHVTHELVLVGPHWVGVVVTLSIIVCCTGLFVHQQCALLPWYYTAITLGFCGMTLYYLYGVACKDPGIVRPRRTDKVFPQQKAKPAKTVLMDDDDSDAGVDNADDIIEDDEDSDLESGSPRSRPSISRRSPSSYGSSRTRYCDICEITQDLYTEHCEDCGVCIEDYDHHCPWMGKCIGKNNMHAFKMFNLSWVLYVIFVLAVSIQNVDWGDAAVQRLHRLSTGEWVPVTDVTKSPHFR